MSEMLQFSNNISVADNTGYHIKYKRIYRLIYCYLVPKPNLNYRIFLKIKYKTFKEVGLSNRVKGYQCQLRINGLC